MHVPVGCYFTLCKRLLEELPLVNELGAIRQEGDGVLPPNSEEVTSWAATLSEGTAVTYRSYMGNDGRSLYMTLLLSNSSEAAFSLFSTMIDLPSTFNEITSPAR